VRGSMRFIQPSRDLLRRPPPLRLTCHAVRQRSIPGELTGLIWLVKEQSQFSARAKP
jgi:hypothetical protein